MRKYKLVGLTGTTGSGKGSVTNIFRDCGFEVIDADILAKRATSNLVVLESLKTFFGDDVVRGGVLDRQLLAARAFKDNESTLLLDKIVHPYITPLFFAEVRRIIESGCDKIIFDAPQLFESGLDVLCDFTVAVTADVEIRIERIMSRDGITREQALSRINAQYSDRFFAESCDYVIQNNSDFIALKRATDEVIDKIRR